MTLENLTSYKVSPQNIRNPQCTDGKIGKDYKFSSQ